MQKSRSRGPHVSQSQKNYILKYLQKNPNLAYRKFSPSFTVDDARNEWKSLATYLNSLPGRGSVKTWKQWRKAWQDLKSTTKKKFLRGNDREEAMTREEKLIYRISGGFDDNNQLPSNTVLKLETDESGIDSDEFIPPRDANHYKQEKIEDKDIQENIIIIVASDESENMNYDSDLKTKCLAVSQNTDAVKDKNNEKSDLTEDVTPDQCSNKKEPEFTASYRQQKLIYLRRMARAKERSAMANERIASALERIALARDVNL